MIFTLWRLENERSSLHARSGGVPCVRLTDARHIEGENQLVHFPGDACASSRSTESFHAFNSACEENRLLLKFDSRGAAGAGTTLGLAAHSRYLAL